MRAAAALRAGRGEARNRDEEARPALTRGERTRARIVAAAVDEFAEAGFHAAKISNIVARAGMTQPTFYLYFDTKDAAYRHIVNRVRTELLEVVESARLPPTIPAGDVREGIRTAIEAFLRYFSDNPKLAKIGYFADSSVTSIREEIVALVARNIAFEQGAGYFRQDLDPVFVSQCYNGSLERVIEQYLLSNKYSAEQLSEKVLDIYVNGWIPQEFMRESSPPSC